MQSAVHDGNQFRSLSLLDTWEQAELLAQMALQARLINLTFDEGLDAAPALADDLESALARALDAEAPDESIAAQDELVQVLDSLRSVGLQVSAAVSKMPVEGVLGVMNLPVLTAKLSAV
ncbi:MAG: hypothetical protein ACM3PU_13805 [Gemmatimonadota bacterium]